MKITRIDKYDVTDFISVDLNPEDYLYCEDVDQLYNEILDELGEYSVDYSKYNNEWCEIENFKEFKREWLKLKENEINKEQEG